MKALLLFPVLVSMALGEIPGSTSPSELNTKMACTSTLLILTCASNRIKIHTSAFGTSDRTPCDPQSAVCDNMPTTTNIVFHREIRECEGKRQCGLSVKAGSVDWLTCSKFISDFVKIIFCCVSDGSIPCQDNGTTTTTTRWTSFPETETPIPGSTWTSPNTTLNNPTTTSKQTTTTFEQSTIIDAPGKDNTALIAGGVVGGLAGGAGLIAVIVIIVKKCKPGTKKKEKPSIVVNNPPAVNNMNRVSAKPPGVYYVKTQRQGDNDSHHYEGIDPSRQYYNLYNHYESIDYADANNNNTENEPRANADNDNHYEEIGSFYLGLYNGSEV